MIKKRKARRTADRIKKEYELNQGESMKTTLQRLRNNVAYKNKRIGALNERIKELEEEKRKEVSEVSKVKNREIRKRETIIRNLNKKAQEKREREGRKFKRSIIYKNRWKEFEPSASVLSLKKNIQKVSSISKSRIEIFEIIQKISCYIDNYNKENGTNLTIESVVALITFYLIDDVRGVMVTSHNFYGLSPHKTRKVINDLVKADLVTKKSVWYNVNLRGGIFIDNLEEYLNKGSSEVLKIIKNG